MVQTIPKTGWSWPGTWTADLDWGYNQRVSFRRTPHLIHTEDGEKGVLGENVAHLSGRVQWGKHLGAVGKEMWTGVSSFKGHFKFALSDVAYKSCVAVRMRLQYLEGAENRKCCKLRRFRQMIGCRLNASLWKYGQAHPIWSRPGATSKHNRGIIYLVWLRDLWGSLGNSRRMWKTVSVEPY